MAEVIDRAGNCVLTHAICRWCGRPSWDHYPQGVVEDRYRCPWCGHKQNEAGSALFTSVTTARYDEPPLPDITEVAV